MRPYIVGNWKLYPTLSDSLVLAATLKRRLESLKGVEVVLAPPNAWLVPVVEAWRHPLSHVHFAAQNIWPEDQGAYTGEMSAYMAKDLVKYALIGHSERRLHAHEDDDLVREKVQACLRWRLRPIVCVGEAKRIIDSTGRVDTYQWQKVENEMMESLHGVKDDDLGRILIAYEPLWAISSATSHNPARPEYAAEVIRRLRARLGEKYGVSRAAEVPILYGGSVSKDDAADYLRQEGIDGILAGAVSVKAADFIAICELAARRA
ncbi:MAG: triose-phosphate isomerase [Candidatus Berkelbacteria bacterium]|nr:MAG: triose-phosphate isomerase [Candidatus Berkelbacteria bacterium]QQG51541.1 MAG: triose-phosphate isomerase [Candidatus Berkelbacteria bacterium]